MTRRRIVLSLLFAPLLARQASAQSDFGAGRPEERYFTVEAQVGTGRRGPVAEGYVYNRYDFQAARMQLAVTPVDAAGRALPAVTAYVGEVPPRNRTYFQVPLPAGTTNVKATVASFEWTPRGGGAS